MHRRLMGLVVFGVVAALFTGCSSSGALHTRSHMLVSTDWLADHLSDPNVVVLQAGMTRGSYDAGHVPGARFVAWSDVAVTRDGLPNEIPPAVDLLALVRRLGIEETKRIVLYDDAGGLPAARAYVALDYMGLGRRSALLDGGWQKWKVEGRPVSTEAPAPAMSSFVPRLRPGLVVTFKDMKDYDYLAAEVGGAPLAILDARPFDQYTGEDAGEGIKRGGHIPGATSVFWMQTLTSRDRPTLKPVDDLRLIFQQAGAQPGDTTIAYCRTGGQASFLYFVLRYLGYDARLYDGSFYEWQSAPDTKVVEGARP
jgi:thiosulfate/3-mercaptopyruvate sulfurtransferase